MNFIGATGEGLMNNANQSSSGAPGQLNPVVSVAGGEGREGKEEDLTLLGNASEEPQRDLLMFGVEVDQRVVQNQGERDRRKPVPSRKGDAEKEPVRHSGAQVIDPDLAELDFTRLDQGDLPFLVGREKGGEDIDLFFDLIQ